MPTYPYSYNLAPLMRKIRGEPSNILYIGDSLHDATSNPPPGALAASLPNRLVTLRTNGVVMPGCRYDVATAFGPVTGKLDNVAGQQTRAVGFVNSGDYLVPNACCVSPGGKATYTSEPGGGSQTARVWMTAAQRNALYGGDPFAAATNWTTGFCMARDPSAASGNLFTYRTSVNDAGTFATNTGQSAGGVNPFVASTAVLGHDTDTYAKIAGGTLGTQNPCCWIAKSSGTFNAGFANYIGHKLISDVQGCTHSFMAHVAIAPYHYRTDSTIFLDAAITSWMNFCQQPDVLWFNVGTNLTPRIGDAGQVGSTAGNCTGEFSQSVQDWKDVMWNNANTWVKRYYTLAVAARVAAGKTPNVRIVLTVPHYTGKDNLSTPLTGGPWQRPIKLWEIMEQAMFELAAQLVTQGFDVSVINWFRAAPVDRAGNTASTTNGDLSEATSLTKDGVHFTVNGGDKMVDLINQLGDDSLTDPSGYATTTRVGGYDPRLASLAMGTLDWVQTRTGASARPGNS